MEIQQLVSPSRQCSSTPVGFGQGFCSKERCTNTGASRHTLLLTWLQLIFTCSLYCNQQWRDSAFAMLLTPLRMRWESWRGCHKMASRIVFNIYTVAGKVYSYTRGIFWRKCSLNDYTVLYFTEIKWFREHFEAITCISHNYTRTPFIRIEMAIYQDMQKIRIIGIFFENRLHWQLEVEKNFQKRPF